MTRILIIDDEEANVRMLSMSLKIDGYDVVTALSGEEGLAVYEAHRPDIVLTDIKMPGMDGIEVLRRIKALGLETEVILVTGHGDIENAIESLKLGASDFLAKPVRDEALAVALDRAREKLEIKARLKSYTKDLERSVAAATKELKRQSNFLSKLFNSSSNAIVATDENFTVALFNPEAERLLGYSHEEVQGRVRALDLYPEDIVETFTLVPIDRSAIKETPWRESVLTDKDGARIPVRFTGTLLFEGDKMMGSVAFFLDLREIKRLEHELVRSERLAAVGQTVAGLAHGIKNILHGFKGGSYLVDIGISKSDPEKLKVGWDMIQRNINRTSELVMDLLAYSKERQPEFEPCFPNQIATDVCDVLEETARANEVELIRDFDPDLGQVVLDPRTLHAALMNLVSNAIDACLFDEDTTKKWWVRVKTRFGCDQTVIIDVIDNGKGMTDEVKSQIFSSFFSTKGHRGTGLGLLVTRKMVSEHKGKVSVISTPGNGARFTIQLPYQQVPGSA